MSEKRKADDDFESASNKPNKKEKKRVEDEEEDASDDGNKSDSNSDDSNDGTAAGGAGVSAENSLPLPCRVKGPEHCGTLLICGGMNWDMAGKRDPGKAAPGKTSSVGRNLWTPHRFSPLENIRVRVVASGCTAAHSVIVTEDGRCLTFGRNAKGQLGVGDCNRRDSPTVVESLKEETVVGAACGRHHTLFLTDRGEVYSAGENKMGQCGIGNQHPVVSTATKIKYKGAPIVKVDCGGEFSLLLDCRGVLFSFGCPEYGQLGNNTDGKYFVTSTKLGYSCETKPKRIMFYIEKARDGHTQPMEDVEIRDVACGTNHSVAVDSKKRVYSWGFGGYGRLGHAEPKDEMMPRLIKFFDAQARGVKQVFCGSSYSMCLTDVGNVYMWGQTKRSGEANMYPKPVQDLSGWDVRSIGCSNTSILVAADESVIGWGPSPTCGELGLGEMRKSSTTPLEVKALEGIHVLRVTCGLSHSLMIARDESEEDKTRLSDLPLYSVP